MLKSWLATHWVASALIMACMLIALLPLGIGDRSLPVTLVYLALPAYMAHQVEEHAGDRFRIFVNSEMFGGIEALTVADVLWINLPGVWGVNLLALYAAQFSGWGYGLAAPYLMLINGITHIAASARKRSYNPGLITSLVVFMPLSAASLSWMPATAGQHMLGLAISVLIHVLIVVRVSLNARALRARSIG